MWTPTLTPGVVPKLFWTSFRQDKRYRFMKINLKDFGSLGNQDIENL